MWRIDICPCWIDLGCEEGSTTETELGSIMPNDPPQPLEADISWSEQTTPASEYSLDETIVRQRTPQSSAPRVLREHSVRRRPQHHAHQHRGPYDPARALMQNYSLERLNTAAHRHASDASNCSSYTFVTSSTSTTDPWSTSGFVEEEDEEAMDMDTPSHDSDEYGEVLIKEEIDSPDNEVRMTELQEVEVEALRSPGSGSGALQVKRPRGRPRKHPIPTLESMAKVAKGRSKTGCITCRRRKKKCDEAKPRCEFTFTYFFINGCSDEILMV